VDVKPDLDRSEPDRHEATESEAHAAPRAAASSSVLSAGRWAWEWTKSILIAFVLFLVIRTFLVEAFRIPTGSMENTLLVGDFLLVNKAVYGAQVPGTGVQLPAFDQPKRGDIVVFIPPHEPTKNYVKRLVGIPGDTLHMESKVLHLNGQPQQEPYAQHSDPGDIFVPSMYWQRDHILSGTNPGDYRPTRDSWGPLVVPEDHFFVLGDNRDDSEDSRYWGFVRAAAVKGQPLFVYYSFDPRTLRPFPWLTEIRWGRIGGTVH
jgi:signal peptidase I